jgi:hypothetical protein
MSSNQRWKDRYTRLDGKFLKDIEMRRKINGTVLAVSTIFQYGKTTVPKKVRSRLNVEDGDKLIWSVDGSGNIIATKGREDTH